MVFGKYFLLVKFKVLSYNIFFWWAFDLLLWTLADIFCLKFHFSSNWISEVYLPILVFWRFQVVLKCDIGLKWVKLKIAIRLYALHKIVEFIWIICKNLVEQPPWGFLKNSCPILFRYFPESFINSRVRCSKPREKKFCSDIN